VARVFVARAGGMVAVVAKEGVRAARALGVAIATAETEEGGVHGLLDISF
jgi:hypothetical protein